MRTLGFVSLLLAGVLAPAAAQDARLRSRLDSATAVQVERLVDSARARRLPAEALIQKALEGKSKGAEPARIVAAVAALLDALGQSRESLGGEAPNDELIAGALWLRAGGQPSDLAALRAAAPGRSLAVPLVVSADLVNRGWPRAEAFQGVRTLLTARVPDQDFLSLRDGVDQAIRRGTPVSDAARNEISRLSAKTSRRQ